MFHSDINAEMQNMHLSDKIMQQQQQDVVKLNLNLLHENQLLRERNNHLTQHNNQLMIEISQLKLEIDMMDLKKGWNFDDRWANEPKCKSAVLLSFAEVEFVSFIA